MRRNTVLAAVAAAALSMTGLATTSSGASAAAAGPRTTNGCLTSVPDPGSTEKVEICWTLFKPASASRTAKVPLLMHSHGWGGSRTTDAASFRTFLDAGYGVLSYDQRGFGESGGQAHVENPRVEGHDVRRLVRLVAQQPWVRKDGRNDPRLGAIGGSYGGGYQYLGAFEHLRLRGEPVFDALAPEITWNDLNRSLAPEGVVRTEWALSLSAAALPSDSLPPSIYKALVEGSATGEWPDGDPAIEEDLVAFFKRNGPKWHVDHGRRLDIPC
jgi:pimeloyl-ACP methyl ester carboxylesterase